MQLNVRLVRGGGPCRQTAHRTRSVPNSAGEGTHANDGEDTVVGAGEQAFEMVGVAWSGIAGQAITMADKGGGGGIGDD